MSENSSCLDKIIPGLAFHSSVIHGIIAAVWTRQCGRWVNFHICFKELYRKIKSLSSVSFFTVIHWWVEEELHGGFPCIANGLLIYINKIDLVKCFKQMLHILSELLKIKQTLRITSEIRQDQIKYVWNSSVMWGSYSSRTGKERKENAIWLTLLAHIAVERGNHGTTMGRPPEHLKFLHFHSHTRNRTSKLFYVHKFHQKDVCNNNKIYKSLEQIGSEQKLQVSSFKLEIG